MKINDKLKVVTFVGTRPELIRLSRVIVKLDQHCNHILVHTGQNFDFELNEIFFKDLEIRQPDYYLAAAGESASETIGNVITASDQLLRDLQPDSVLVLGDTNSCLAVLSAKRLKIPTFHMEAGNRCFDMRVPEEINRKIVDHIADINLTYSTLARDYLLREGLPPDRIIKTGSPMLEVLNFYRKKIDASNVITDLNLKHGEFFLFSSHREENVEPDKSFNSLINVLNNIAENFGIPIVVSTHPRTQKRIDNAQISFHPKIRLIKPVSFTDYIKLQTSARAVLSDSGTVSEESSIINFPALNIREAHERPESMEEASVMMVGLKIERIMQALSILESQPKGENRSFRMVEDYNKPNVSDKIVRIIHSYTDYVNRVVWKKH